LGDQTFSRLVEDPNVISTSVKLFNAFREGMHGKVEFNVEFNVSKLTHESRNINFTIQ
jgi:hypothetical protein